MEGKQWNGFFSPSAYDTEGAVNGVGESVNAFSPDGEFEYHMQIGSKLYPEYPIRSHDEAYYQFRKTLGHHSYTFQGFVITAGEYKSTKFIIGIERRRS